MWAAVIVFTVLAAGSWLTGMIVPELLELLLAIEENTRMARPDPR